MDGDLAPLAEIVALKEKYGAWLMIDEAHATGLYAKNRRGLAEAGGCGGQDRRDTRHAQQGARVPGRFCGRVAAS